MSISTLAELSAAVPVWLGRDGDPVTSAQINDIITLAETGIIYGSDAPFQAPPVRLRFMETVLTTFSITGKYTPLPTGFLEARSLMLASTPQVALHMRSPQDLDEMDFGSSTDSPEVYAIQGNQLRVAPGPAGPFTATLTYWALPRLNKSDPASTNVLLQNAPNIYLTAACMQGAHLLGDVADAQRWFALYRSALGGLQSSDEAGTWSGSTLVMNAPGPKP